MLLSRYHNSNSNNNKAAGATDKEQVAPKPTTPLTEETPKVDKKSEPEYTEEKIKSMTGAQLRKLATKNGVENPEELTAGELKSVLCGILVK